MSTYKIFLNYTDAHDVDEDLRTITHHGGDWTHICRAGVTERFISTDTSFVNEYVASYVCEHHLLTLDGYHNVGHKIPTDQSIHMYLYLYKFI